MPGGVEVGQEGLEFLIGFEDAGLRHVIDRFDRLNALAPHLIRDRLGYRRPAVSRATHILSVPVLRESRSGGRQQILR
jgi:hypothetical protein